MRPHWCKKQVARTRRIDSTLHHTTARFTPPDPWSQKLRGDWPARLGWHRLLSGSCPSAHDLRFTLPSHTRSPSCSCACASLAVTSLREDLHLQECAHTGRTKQNGWDKPGHQRDMDCGDDQALAAKERRRNPSAPTKPTDTSAREPGSGTLLLLAPQLDPLPVLTHLLPATAKILK